jgi:isoquinoline 1-oxidoreductase subunit beta
MLDEDTSTADGVAGIDRRSFVGYVLAGTTLVAAADFALSGPVRAADGLNGPQVAELYDLNDFITDSCLPTANLITVTVNSDGTASFALPRSENGQGITTSTAMIIAEELELPVSKVHVTLADARPELLFNQLTGGSSTTTSTYTPIRVAAAAARGALLEAAALTLGAPVQDLIAKGGVVQAPGGKSASYGELATAAAATKDRAVEVTLKDTGAFRVVGVGQNRVDAHDAVTGRKTFTTDLKIKDALPTMVCRAPTLNGTPKRLLNRSRIAGMPGVRDLAIVDTGVAVRADTFGQCIDAVRAMRVDWAPGTVAGKSDQDIVDELKAAELPIVPVPDLPGLAQSVESSFTFYFRGNSALDTNAAVADVRSDRAEIWSALKTPIAAQAAIAQACGLSQDKVKVHVMQGGGSFGRRLFFDAALEAAKISKAMGKPVKLMWHRADDARVGRTHPMATSRVRATYAGDQMLAFQMSHTSVETDFRHGLGEALTAAAADLPSGLGNLTFSESIFALTTILPYDFAVKAQLLNEVESGFNTGSMRNIYSPDVRTAGELVIDQLASKMGLDPYQFRKKHLSNERVLAVLNKVAEVGQWGKPMKPGTAQGIAIHEEYKGATACLVEIDCRPKQTKRKIRDGVGGPRVTRVTFAVDAGLPINPRGLEAQMQGGINDGIAQVLTSSLHLRDGHFLEASWDNYFYTRQWNTPPQVQVIVMPPTTGLPGGAGEAGVAASMAAVACAYARATGHVPTYFPINHEDPLHFKVKSFVPPIPPSPVNGLKKTY